MPIHRLTRWPIFLFSLMILSHLALPGLAQADDPTTAAVGPLQYGQAVSGTITNTAFFDWWRVEMTRGDTVQVQMQAQNGLAPLLAVLDVNQGGVLARSDDPLPTPIDSMAELTFQAPADGIYTVVATRDGNEQGDTTGAYDLRIALIDRIPERDNPRAEVEFRCGELLISNALTLTFEEDGVTDPNSELLEFYRLTVIGSDGFQPVIRARSDVREALLDCTDNGDRVPGSRYTLPGADPVTVTADDLPHVAQLALRNTGGTNAARFGAVELTIGALNGQPGRYVAILEGLRIHEPNDTDLLTVRLGPLARAANIRLYMVGAGDALRFDPQISVVDANGFVTLTCDDAGRFDCADVPSFAGASLYLPTTPELNLLADRFDAGLNLTPGNTDPIQVRLQSRSQRTDGRYTLVIIGELPA